MRVRFFLIRRCSSFIAVWFDRERSHASVKYMSGRFRDLWLFLPLAISMISGCATAPPSPEAPSHEKAVPTVKPTEKRKTSPLPRRCKGMCAEIDRCAAESGHSDLSQRLCELARCETGDKCFSRIRSPNGRYRGVFQFSKRTWRSQCGPIFRRKNIKACAGPKAIFETCCSTICAAELIAAGGIGNWPTCGQD